MFRLNLESINDDASSDVSFILKSLIVLNFSLVLHCPHLVLCHDQALYLILWDTDRPIDNQHHHHPCIHPECCWEPYLIKKVRVSFGCSKLVDSSDRATDTGGIWPKDTSIRKKLMSIAKNINVVKREINIINLLGVHLFSNLTTKWRKLVDNL